MPWRVSWLDKQETILLVKLVGKWSWDDFEAACNYGLPLITSKSCRVHIICDLTEGHEPPDNKVLAPVRRAYAKRPTNCGLYIVVGATPFIQVAISVITKVMGGTSTFRYTDTVDEARALVAGMPARNGG